MKILQILDGYIPEHFGGIASCVRTENEELARRGHEVTVLTRLHHASTERLSLIDGYRVIRHNAPRAGSRWYYAHPMTTAYALPRLLREIQRREKFDAVCVHNTFHAAALARASLDTRTVFRFHAPASIEIGLDATSGKYGAKGRVVGRVLKWVDSQEDLGLSRVDRVAALSNFMASELRRVHPEFQRGIAIVPASVDLARFEFAPVPVEHREALGIPSDRRVLLTVRRLVGRMGLETLVKTIDLVRRDRPEVLLIIVGKGYLEPRLKAMTRELGLEDHVRFAGYVSDEDLPAYYRSADLFVLPTEHLEGFGVVTLEAMSSGTPVVATGIGANSEVAGGFDPDLVSRSAAPGDLAVSIGTGLSKAVDAEYRRACREHAADRYSSRRVVDLVEQMLS